MSELPKSKSAVIVAGYLAAYVLLDWVSYVYPVLTLAITPWNPPPGLSLFLLLEAGPRFAPALFVAALLAEFLVRGLPAPLAYVGVSSAVLATGYTVMAAWLRRLGFGGRFDRTGDLQRLIAVIVPGTLAVSTLFVGVFHVAGLVPAPEYASSVLRFWVGDLIGILVTTPFLLIHARPGLAVRLRRRPSRESVLQAASVLAALWVVFGLEVADELKLFYVLFVPLIWIAMRHGIEGATLAVLAIQLGLVAAVQLYGQRTGTLLEFQLLMLALATTGLFLGIVVSERRRTAADLAVREAELLAIVGTAPDGILTVDEHGIIASANAAAERILHYPAGGLRAVPFARVVPAITRLAPVQTFEVVATDRSGNPLPLEISVGVARTGGSDTYIVVARDIARRREVESRLREQEASLNKALRLAAAGEMASALAHELNQPLSAVGNYVLACQVLLDQPERDGLLRETMDKVVAQVERAGQVVHRLRDFFRSGITRLEPIPAADLARRAAETVRSRAERHRVRLDADVDPMLPAVSADRTQIETVLHNLLTNAIDVLADTGATRREIRLHAGVVEPSTVEFAVDDSGPGVTDAIAERLFQPFATSKPDGMGLGLAISRSLVEAHGGRFSITQSALGGASFRFTLPIADPERLHDDPST